MGDTWVGLLRGWQAKLLDLGSVILLSVCMHLCTGVGASVYVCEHVCAVVLNLLNMVLMC